MVLVHIKHVPIYLVMIGAIFAPFSFANAATAVIPASPYLYNFDQAGTVNETGSMSESSSPYWWVNSGGGLTAGVNGRGGTLQGNLPLTNPWRALYAAANPEDTDLGLHPQNIFRLLARSTWQNVREEAYFVINKDNLSSSSNRNQSNGLLLMSRYQDSQNLYYAGVRVDGSAIIKKKQNGTYTTLAEVKNVFPGTWNRSTNPNLLPKNKWIGLRSETVNNSDGSVTVRLYMDLGWKGAWKLIAEATDKGTSSGAPITKGGYAGIRTDFMDVQFENYRLRTI